MLTSGSVVVGEGRFSQVTCKQVIAVTRQKALFFFSGGISSSHDRATLLCQPLRCVFRVLLQFVNVASDRKRSRPVESRRVNDRRKLDVRLS